MNHASSDSWIPIFNLQDTPNSLIYDHDGISASFASGIARIAVLRSISTYRMMELRLCTFRSVQRTLPSSALQIGIRNSEET
jgi:hypothetical protein